MPGAPAMKYFTICGYPLTIPVLGEEKSFYNCYPREEKESKQFGKMNYFLKK